MSRKFKFKCGVYEMRFSNDQFYIGATRDLPRRKGEHKYAYKTGAQFPLIAEAWDLYGEPTFRLILVCRREDLKLYESMVIEKFNPTLNVMQTSRQKLMYMENSLARIEFLKNPSERNRLRTSLKKYYSDPARVEECSRKATEFNSRPSTKKLKSEGQRGVLHWRTQHKAAYYYGA